MRGRLLSVAETKITAEAPIASWEVPVEASDALPAHSIAFELAPVLVCKEPIRTVGLGDAISASALAAQI